MTCLFALQQLQVGPRPAQVGREVVVAATAAEAPAAGVAVAVQLPGGESASVGVTDADGLVRYTPAAVGQHAFAAEIDGVRCVAPIAVAPARERWLLALASVPLGLALLFVHLRRARGGRGAPTRTDA